MRHNNTTVWFQNYKPILPAIAQGSSLHCPIRVTYASPPCSGIPAQVPHMKHTPWRRPLDQPYAVGAALPRETAYCSSLVFGRAALMGVLARTLGTALLLCSVSNSCCELLLTMLRTRCTLVMNCLHSCCDLFRELLRTVLTALLL